MAPFTRWQRLVARMLPWYDPDAQEQAIAHTDELTAAVGRIAGIRIAYREVGDRQFVERRRVAR